MSENLFGGLKQKMKWLSKNCWAWKNQPGLVCRIKYIKKELYLFSVIIKRNFKLCKWNTRIQSLTKEDLEMRI